MQKYSVDELIQNKIVLQSNTSGPFIIKEKLGNRRVLIEFINTGTLSDVTINNAINHRVADKLLSEPSKDFVQSRIDDYDKYINNLLQNIYYHMIRRCNDENNEKFCSYGAKGIKVCNRWKESINNFFYDARFIDGFDKFYNRPNLYQLDKDYKQINIPKCNRIYSKETCIFLYYQDNLNLRIIENNKSGYYGVEINSAGNYYTRIKINGNRYNIGTFNNLIAACNAYNYWQLYFHNFELVPLLNKVPYMPPEEFIKYNVHVKQMCNLQLDK